MPNLYSWYTNKAKRESPDSIHQTLAYGTLNEIRSLNKALGEDTIKDLFIAHPKKIYIAPALNFIKKFILHLSISFDEQKYLKSTPRHTR